MTSAIIPQQVFINLYAQSDDCASEVKERAIIMEQLLDHVQKHRETLLAGGGYVWFENHIPFVDRKDFFEYSISGVDKRGELMTHCETFCQVIPSTVNWQYIDNKTLSLVVNAFIKAVK